MKGYDVHATNKRLFISSFDGNTIGEYDYAHVSSLVYNIKRYRWLIAIGVAIIILSWISINGPQFRINSPVIWLGIAAGAACIIAGVLFKQQYMKIFVVGVPHPVPLHVGRADDNYDLICAAILYEGFCLALYENRKFLLREVFGSLTFNTTKLRNLLNMNLGYCNFLA